MSLIPASLFPRSAFDWDMWYEPSRLSTGLLGPMSTLDIFDPFDQLDRAMSRNLQWLSQPSFMTDLLPLPLVPEKHRITVDCTGFDPSSIKTDIKDTRLTVSASEGAPSDTQDYVHREFRRTYTLPNNIEQDKMVSFVTPAGQLVIEFPYRQEEKQRQSLLPRIVDDGKRVELDVAVPSEIDPKNISVTCKDRDVIVKADYRVEKGDTFSRVHYYRRSTMPENTDFNNVKCTYDNNRLSITAPLQQMPELRQRKQVPIEFRQQQKQQIQQGQQQMQGQGKGQEQSGQRQRQQPEA